MLPIVPGEVLRDPALEDRHRLGGKRCERQQHGLALQLLQKSEYADLLEAAGVDTVPELARRNAANLTTTMAEANAARNFVRQLPSESQVAGWIAQAGELGRTIEY